MAAPWFRKRAARDVRRTQCSCTELHQTYTVCTRTTRLVSSPHFSLDRLSLSHASLSIGATLSNALSNASDADGVLGTEIGYSRIDHAQLSGGRVVQNMGWGILDIRTDSLPQGTCSSIPPVNGGHDRLPLYDIRTCYVIPPENKTNFVGETHAAALEACQSRCTSLGPAWCDGVNVVPMIAPDGVFFSDENVPLSSGGSERAIPYGISNCASTCFAKETNDAAKSFICYPVSVQGDRSVEEDWTLAVDDTTNEIWYSTVYKKEQFREFKGIGTTCMDYVSAKFPDGLCTLKARSPWRHGDRCISCADKDKYGAGATVVPLWIPLPPGECQMCDFIQAPDVPAPTPPPTVPPSAFVDGSNWEKNWTSADKAIFIGWKFGGAEANDVEASHALTFMLSCMKCDGTGWVAIGVNPTAGTITPRMEGTSALIWKIGEDSIREYEIGPPQQGDRQAGIVPWGSRNHIDRIATDATNRRATFSIGAARSNVNYAWHIGSTQIDNVNATTMVTYAYALTGGPNAQHIARGSVPLRLRLPAHEPVAAARTDVDIANGSSGADTTLATALAILAAVGINVLLVALAVVVVAIIVGILVKARRGYHAELLQNKAPGAIVGKATARDAQAAAPRLPSRPSANVELTPRVGGKVPLLGRVVVHAL